jgi:hypothetical protein
MTVVPESPLPPPSTTLPLTVKATGAAGRFLLMGSLANNVSWQLIKARNKQSLIWQSVSFIQKVILS